MDNKTLFNYLEERTIKEKAKNTDKTDKDEKETGSLIHRGFVFLIIIFFLFSMNTFFSMAKKTLAELFPVFEYKKNYYSVVNLKNTEKQKEIKHIKTPEPVKGIYMTSWVAGTKNRREELIKLADSTEINSIMIDIKDYSGKIFLKTENPLLNSYEALENRIPDLKELIKTLHEKNIYVIGRISVFQDDFLAKKKPEFAIKNSQGGVWRDNKGVSWLDPANKKIWDYTIVIAEESEKSGFDEISFDYIRFPSDGNLKNTVYNSWDGKIPKSEVIKSFFVYLNKNLNELGVPVSANLFGLTLRRTDDMNIGQILENTAPYFDFINPMVYPSHYPKGFNGFKNPAEHPYEIIFDELEKGKERLLLATTSPYKLRPWLQDFDLGADYNASMIKKEKQAVYDAGLDSWMSWNASNRYTEKAYEKN